MTSLAGAPITGTGAVTVTPTVCDAAFPKLSVTETWMLSGADDGSVSLSVARSAFT